MKAKRARLFERQNGICHYCDVEMVLEMGRGFSCTQDHVIPKKRGGYRVPNNSVGACKRCNDLKGSLSEKAFRIEYPSPDAIEAASPMAKADEAAKRAYAQEVARRTKANMQKTVDGIAATSFVGNLVALDADGKEVAIFHPKEKT